MSTYTVSVQRYAPTGHALAWETGAPSELSEGLARMHLADLTRRYRRRNLVKLPNGIEFDSYAAGCVPLGCPELADARTRVTFEF